MHTLHSCILYVFRPLASNGIPSRHQTSTNTPGSIASFASFVEQRHSSPTGNKQQKHQKVAEDALPITDMSQLPTVVMVALLEREELLNVIQAHIMQAYIYPMQQQLDWAQAQHAQVSNKVGV